MGLSGGNRIKLELSDDWHQDEPLAYLVKCFDTTIHEYKVFADDREAESYANQQQEESGADSEYDGRVFPLYAGNPGNPIE